MLTWWVRIGWRKTQVLRQLLTQCFSNHNQHVLITTINRRRDVKISRLAIPFICLSIECNHNLSSQVHLWEMKLRVQAREISYLLLFAVKYSDKIQVF